MDESYERVAQETGMYHSEDRDRPRSEGRDGNVPGDSYWRAYCKPAVSR
jgi:hypothetical protein